MASLLLPYLLSQTGDDYHRHHYHQNHQNDLLEALPYIIMECQRPRVNGQLSRRGQNPIAQRAQEDCFKMNLDVKQFAPEEITVKVVDDKTVCVEAKHEEQQDEHGFVSRHFVRKFTLPDGFDINSLQSNLSTDGVLAITAPKIAAQNKDREIPIIRTGQPAHKQLQENKEAKDEKKECKK